MILIWWLPVMVCGWVVGVDCWWLLVVALLVGCCVCVCVCVCLCVCVCHLYDDAVQGLTAHVVMFVWLVGSHLGCFSLGCLSLSFSLSLCACRNRMLLKMTRLGSCVQILKMQRKQQSILQRKHTKEEVLTTFVCLLLIWERVKKKSEITYVRGQQE